MVKISLELAKLHPAFISALPETVDPAKVLETINAAIAAAGGTSEGNIRSTSGAKDTIKVSASGKLSGLVFKKDSPVAAAARVNWYLFGAADLYLRVEEVTLPHSVADWLKSKELAKEVHPAPQPA